MNVIANRAGVLVPGQPLPLVTAQLGRARQLWHNSDVFPALREFPGNRKQHSACAEKNCDLWPEAPDRLVAPEHFRESIDGPCVDGQQSGFLHDLRHEEARKHAAPDRRHDQNHQRRERTQLGPSPADAGE
jgi:hypothetical protein